MKVPLILLSGGLDSTYLLQDRLLSWGPADVLYVNGGQSSIKTTAELRQRRKIIDHFNEHYPHKVQAEWERLSPTGIVNPGKQKWVQAPAWLYGALSCIDPDRHSALQVGYVCDDGAYSGYNLRHREEAWLALQRVCVNGEPVPLQFPLLHMKKVDILRNLDKRLLDKIWICETPKDENTVCGTCQPCILMKNVLHQYKEKFGETVFTTKLLALRDFNPTFEAIDHKHPNYSRSRSGVDQYDIPVTGALRRPKEEITLGDLTREILNGA